MGRTLHCVRLEPFRAIRNLISLAICISLGLPIYFRVLRGYAVFNRTTEYTEHTEINRKERKRKKKKKKEAVLFGRPLFF